MWGIESEALPFFTAISIVTVIFIFIGIAAVSDAVRKTLTAGQIEQSRREIAAYIAEGSLTIEDGERLMAAGQKKGLMSDLGLDSFSMSDDGTRAEARAAHA